MMNHTIPVLTMPAVIVAVSLFFSFGPQTQSTGETVGQAAARSHMPAAVVPDVSIPTSSLYPVLTIDGGTSVQRERLALAVSRFRNAGLVLPDLEVVFATDVDACRGFYGLYQHRAEAPKITYCSELDFVYEHELAHAWEANSATDEQRQEFMDLRGYTSWTGPDVEWNDRGMEGAAFIIQQTIGGRPVPYIRTEEFWSRSGAFEALTGMPDRRLLDEVQVPAPVAFDPTFDDVKATGFAMETPHREEYRMATDLGWTIIT